MMNSQSDETGISDTLDFFFFFFFDAQPWWGNFSRISSKFFVWVFKFLEKTKKIKLSTFLLLPLPEILQNLYGNEKF